jgi:cobalamin biosynthesis protein CobT
MKKRTDKEYIEAKVTAALLRIGSGHGHEVEACAVCRRTLARALKHALRRGRDAK